AHFEEQDQAGDDQHRPAHAEQAGDDSRRQSEQRDHQIVHRTSSPVGLPQAPPPGVSIRSTSPGCSPTAVLAASGAPFSRLRPGAPSPPPAAPRGPWRRRSLRRLASAGANASISRMTPVPPAAAPLPPLPPRTAYVRTRSGNSSSSTSTGVLRVFDMPTCTADGPGPAGPPPCPPPSVS